MLTAISRGGTEAERRCANYVINLEFDPEAYDPLAAVKAPYQIRPYRGASSSTPAKQAIHDHIFAPGFIQNEDLQFDPDALEEVKERA
eukprot:3584886-Amphidinium_carterae.1